MVALEIKNQERTDFCLACVISSIAESVIGEPCEESYLFAAGKRVSGEPLEISGVSPRNLITAAIEYGVLPKRYAPYSIATHNRDFLADWNNWRYIKRSAVKPFKSSYKVRTLSKALELLNNGTPLLCGLFWQAHWNDSPYIDSLGEFNKLSPHEVLLIGIKDGRIMIQNSVGLEKGDKGIWYINKEIFNKVRHHIFCLSEKPKKNWLLDLIDNL